MRNFKQDDFTTDLHTLYTVVSKTADKLNTNEAYNFFHMKYTKLIDKHAPYRTLNKRESKTRQKPWLTKGILTSIDIKRKLFISYKKKKIQETYDKYKIYRDLLNTLCRKSKKLYYKTYFSDNAKKSKKTWSEINKLLNRKRKQQHNFLVLEDGIIQTDKKKCK